jgi:hypothetical protein
MHEFFPKNLRNPARNRRAGLMRQFSSGQLDSSTYCITNSLSLSLSLSVSVSADRCGQDRADVQSSGRPADA